MSCPISGRDVDRICVWIHKIYSAGLLLLSGANKCIQAINFSSSSLAFCAARASTCSGNIGSLSNISVVMGEDQTSIREVWSGLLHPKNGPLRLMKIFFMYLSLGI